MPYIAVNDVKLFYEAAGDPSGAPVLLIAGLGVQMIDWADHFVDPLIESGHYVIRFDNRDIGLSTIFDGPHDPQVVVDAMAAGEDPAVAYTINDMATDAAGLLDALGIAAAHIVGVSMGAMIAQATAISFPDKVLSLTSIMSTTGAGDVGQPTPEAMQAILTGAPGTERDVVIAHNLATAKTWASPEHFDPQRLEQLFSDAWDRVGGPQATNAGRQFCAIMATPSRDEALGSVQVPALVVHGTADTLVTSSGGERTAACLPNAELLIIDGMGHDLAPAFTPRIVRAINDLVAGTTPA